MTTISICLVLSFLVSCSNNLLTNITNTLEKNTSLTSGENIKENDGSNENSKNNSESTDSFTIVNVGGYRDDDKSTYIEIEFSKELKDGFDASSYIKVDPEISYTISKVSKSLLLKGDFSADMAYKLTVLGGIKAVDGSTTGSDKTYDVEFAQKKPKLMFTNDGIILPSVNDKKVYIRSLNVKKLNVIVRKVYANNLTQFLQICKMR